MNAIFAGMTFFLVCSIAIIILCDDDDPTWKEEHPECFDEE